jgi:UDP-N-acetylmuramoyl-L-alanyl-D-glutamate--2,6-diaminopimelate ligase
MKLSKLLSLWCKAIIPDCEITGLNNDSRQIKPGDLFFAYPGAATDGRRYCAQAVAAGAVAVVYDPQNLPADFVFSDQAVYVPVPELVRKLAAIASRFYDHPTRSLTVTGVTGTNGKTTIAWQLAQAHKSMDSGAAYIGTLGQGDVNALQTLGNTTPDALCLQQLFYNYRQQGIQHVCMEVSSHALDQQRVAEIDFKGAIYTNLSHEHLDYHHTLQAYAEAKAALFAMPTLQWAVINHDDAYGQFMAQHLPAHCKKITYGLQEGADVRAINLNMGMTGSAFEVVSPWGHCFLRVKTLGKFNVYNSLAVFASLMLEGYDSTKVVNVMATLNASPGRMDVVAQQPCVIVDYAHTPDALENVLSMLSMFKQGRVWVVFGCGGDRDRTKRPVMGRIASQYADVVIITSDNPRSENPADIIEEIEAGILSSAQVMKIVDRKQAIQFALREAGKQDIVLIAGKGHENYQQIGKERVVFSDQEVVRSFFVHDRN